MSTGELGAKYPRYKVAASVYEAVVFVVKHLEMASEWLLKKDSVGADCHMLHHLVANARALGKRLAMPQCLGANVKDKLVSQTLTQFKVPSMDVSNKLIGLCVSGSLIGLQHLSVIAAH